MEGEFAMLCLLSSFCLCACADGCERKEGLERGFTNNIECAPGTEKEAERTKKWECWFNSSPSVCVPVCVSVCLLCMSLTSSRQTTEATTAAAAAAAEAPATTPTTTTPRRKRRKTTKRNAKNKTHTHTHPSCARLRYSLVVFVPLFLSFSLSFARLFLEGMQVFFYVLFVSVVVNIATAERGGNKFRFPAAALLCVVPVGFSFSIFLSLFLRFYTSTRGWSKCCCCCWYVMFACVSLCLCCLPTQEKALLFVLFVFVCSSLFFVSLSLCLSLLLLMSFLKVCHKCI